MSLPLAISENLSRSESVIPLPIFIFDNPILWLRLEICPEVLYQHHVHQQKNAFEHLYEYQYVSLYIIPVTLILSISIVAKGLNSGCGPPRDILAYLDLSNESNHGIFLKL
jgi:hypothetical protein